MFSLSLQEGIQELLYVIVKILFKSLDFYFFLIFIIIIFLQVALNKYMNILSFFLA